jgi:hypothetical protein
VRIVLSIAAADDLEILHLDVKTSFLYSELNKETFMDQPIGFISNAFSTYVCR